MPKVLALRCNDVPLLQHHIAGATDIIYQKNATSVNLSSIPASHKKEIDYIVMYGSHGNFSGGKPTQLNGLSADAAESLAGQLFSLGISAYSIILDCCFSAGFIPIYKNLLVKGRTKPGTILCHYGSAAGTMVQQLGTSQFSVRQASKGKLDDLSSYSLDFVSLGVYVDGKTAPNLHIKSVANMSTASAQYLSAIDSGGSEASDVNGLKTYLRGEGINLKEGNIGSIKSVMQNAIIV